MTGRVLMASRSLLAASVIGFSSAGSVAASGFKQFKDWYAACDNLRNCSAYGFDPTTNSGYLRIERGGAADAPVRITISTDLADAADYKLTFDPALPGLPDRALIGEEGEGNEFRRSLLAEGPAAKPLIESLRKANAIIITRRPARGKKLETPVSKISTWGLLRDSVNLAMAGVPAHIELPKVKACLEQLPGVSRVHHVHVWGMSTNEVALTAHLVMPGGHPGNAFFKRAAHELHERFGIAHPTLQIETVDGAGDEGD